jgi:hypothetical protein
MLFNLAPEIQTSVVFVYDQSLLFLTLNVFELQFRVWFGKIWFVKLNIRMKERSSPAELLNSLSGLRKWIDFALCTPFKLKYSMQNKQFEFSSESVEGFYLSVG